MLFCRIVKKQVFLRSVSLSYLQSLAIQGDGSDDAGDAIMIFNNIYFHVQIKVCIFLK